MMETNAISERGVMGRKVEKGLSLMGSLLFPLLLSPTLFIIVDSKIRNPRRLKKR